MNELHLHLVHPKTLAAAWFCVAPLLSVAVERSAGEYSLEDVFNFLSKGMWQLWVAVDEDQERIAGALTTEIVDYARKRVCRLVLLGVDDLQAVNQFLPDIEHWALQAGAVELEAYWRPGFSRKLALRYGFDIQYHVAIKSLSKRIH
jgi:hypothetical protein